MPANILQIGAEFDVSNLVAGTKQAVASFDQTTASVKELNLQAGVTSAAHARATQSLNQAGQAAEKSGYSYHEARGAAKLLAEELGLHLNRELASTAAHSAVIGPLLSKAFTVFAIVGFIELLKQVPEAIINITDKLAGWDEEAKAAYQRMLDDNIKMIASNVKLADSIRELNLIGTEGQKKYGLAIKDAQESLKAHAAVAAEFLRQQQSEAAEYEKHATLIKILGALWLLNDETVKNYNEHQKMLTEALKEQYDVMRQISQVTIPKENLEAAADAVRKATQLQIAQQEHYRSYSEAVTSYDQEIYKNRQRLGEISASQEAELTKRSLVDEFNSQTTYYEKIRALKIAEGQKTGADVRAEVERMDSEQEGRRVALNKKLQEIDTTTEVERRRQSIETAKAEIEANLSIAESQLRVNEVKQKQALSESGTPGEAEAAAVPYIKTITEQYQLQAKAKQEEAEAVLKAMPANLPKPTADFGTAGFAEQLKAIKDIAPQIYATLLKLNADEIKIRNDGKAKVEEAEKEKNDVVKKLRLEEARDQLTAIEDQNEKNKEAYERDQANLENALTLKKINMAQYVAETDALAKKAYDEQVALIEREIDLDRRLAEQKIINEQELHRRLLALWKQQEEAYIQMQRREEAASKKATEEEERQIKAITQKIAQDFAQTFTQVITGHMKVGDAAKKLGLELEQYIIEQGIKKVAERFLTSLLTMVTEHSSTAAKILGISTASDQEESHQNAAKNVADVISDAAAGAAAAAAAAAPAGPDASAAAAAAEEALIISYVPQAAVAYEYGGRVPGFASEAVPVIAHGGERILDSKVSSFIQTAADRFAATPTPGGAGSTTNRTQHNHIRVELHNHGKAMTQDEVTAAVKTAIRRGALP